MTHALRYSPEPAVIALTCALLVMLGGSAYGADPTWTDTRQIGPFICHATFALDEYEVLFAELPELQREITRTLGLPAGREPISVFLFQNEPEHRDYLKRHYGQIPYRRALFVKEGGRAGVYAYRHEELDIDLRHECTHALLHAVLPTVPLWLDEGLAEYFEVPPARRAFDHPHFDSLRWNMRLGMVQPIESLEQHQQLAEMDGYDYRYSWAWVHFMLHGPEPAHRTLVNYLAQVYRSGKPENATDGISIRQANYLSLANRDANGNSLSKQLAQNLPNSTERMVQHFKYWHR